MTISPLHTGSGTLWYQKRIDMDTIKSLDKHTTVRQVIFTVIVLACLTPLVSPPLALVLGLFVALFVGHPFPQLNHRATNLLLQVSVVGLGFGINAASALRAGKEGFLFAAASIAGTLSFGLLLGRLFHIEKKTSLLISGGTAICGGSAIAALSPVIRADERQVSVAMGTIFILNSVALFLFPVIGHLLHLSQTQFGLWSAIAIHDTSSVVGAAGRYGPEALQIATTVKLARALWIIPVSLLAALLFRSSRATGSQATGNQTTSSRATGSRATGSQITGGTRPNIKSPWFIGLFVAAILLNTWLPLPALDHVVIQGAHAGLTLTLFLIGSGLSMQVLRNTGVKPLLQGVILWALISVTTLWAIVSLVS
jgi:uncharacterized integral membrane protein (TIGR00698 family)